MPAPSEALGTMRPDLGQALAEFDLTGNRKLFIGHQVFPILPVEEQSGSFPVFSVEQLLQNQNTERASDGSYPRGSAVFGKGTFATAEYGWEEVVDQRNAAIYRNWYDKELFGAARALDIVLNAAERRISAAVFNATTWTGSGLTTAVSTEWSTVATAIPITDIDNAKKKVWAATGIWPNALVINRHVFMNLRNCAQVIERIGSGGAGDAYKATDVTADMLARVFDLDRVIVAGGAQNSANEGQSVSIANIWSSEYAMVAKLATGGDPLEPCIGRTLHWAEDGSTPDGTVESYTETKVRGEIIRVRHEVDEKVIMAATGHLLSNITA